MRKNSTTLAFHAAFSRRFRSISMAFGLFWPVSFSCGCYYALRSLLWNISQQLLIECCPICPSKLDDFRGSFHRVSKTSFSHFQSHSTHFRTNFFQSVKVFKKDFSGFRVPPHWWNPEYGWMRAVCHSIRTSIRNWVNLIVSLVLMMSSSVRASTSFHHYQSVSKTIEINWSTGRH